MSYGERRSIMGFVFSLGFFIAFYQILNQQDFIGFNVQEWGSWFLIFFLSWIISRVVFTVVHVVIEAIIIGIKTRGDEATINAELQEDERTQAIDRKSSVHLGTVLFSGLVIGMVLLAFNQPIHVFFITLYLTFGVVSLFYDCLSLIYQLRER